MIKQFFCVFVALLTSVMASAKEEVASPDGRLCVELSVKEDGGKLCYRVIYDGVVILEDSPLGLLTNIGDYRDGLTLKQATTKRVQDEYSVRNIKQKNVSYEANELIAELDKGSRHVMDVEFRVSNRDVALRYRIFPRVRLAYVLWRKRQQASCSAKARPHSFARSRSPWAVLPAPHPVTRLPIRSMSL
jgi:hypothetical protein